MAVVRRNIAITLIDLRDGVLSAIACSIRGDVKNILLPPPEARLRFAASSPWSDRSDARVLCLALWFCFARSQPLHVHEWRQRQWVSETGKHSWLYGVNHGSMCDSRPSAFSGYPRGHRVNTEAQCHRHCAPTGDKDAHPRTRASQEPTGHHQKKITGDGGLFPETLKRLAISVCQRRSFLPSSIESA